MKYLIHTLLVMNIASASVLHAADTARQRLSLDGDWRFYLGDIPMPVITGHGPSYENAKAGKAWGAAAPGYDDSDWRRLDLPHDWAVEGPFDPQANISQGYRPRGVAWYRRYLRLDPADKGRHLELQFEGIATHATVWVNGLLVHRNFCGYTPFQIDLTPIATYGDQLNTIVVRVDANPMEGWWYEGAGLYRHTWLVKRSPVHIATYGLYANPVRDPKGRWSVPVEVTLSNIETQGAAVEVSAELFDPTGKPVLRESSSVTVPALGQTTVSLPLTPSGTPKLWSVDDPVLYTVKATVKRNQGTADSTSTRCGFRTLRFDAKEGFFLNDKPLKLQGTCNHQDHAGVGVAVPDSLWDFRVRKLKELGSNAYRSAHNPPAPEFLEACDRLGMLVMDENRNFNHTPEYLGQLRTMLLRDRNHPSVFLWSVFNEEPMQGTEQGREMVRRMAAEVRKLDATRPVTAAMNGGMMNEHGVFEAVDVMGFNYVDISYDDFHEKHPDLPITSSEDTSAFMTRGEYETDKKRNVIASYDEEHAAWGKSHRAAWKAIAERPFLAGGFVWTGFDYRGEPQRLSWPSVSSVFGIFDLCGFPKTAYHIHRSNWIKDRPVLALAPHWNWAGREGQPIRVIAMTNAEKVALSLNGRPLGEKPRPPYDYVEWEVPYEPGTLEAVGTTAGKEVIRTKVETTGPATALRLEPDRDFLLGDGRDTLPITVSGVDDAGRVVPGADAPVTFSVEGPGRNIGHGNGDHNCHDPEKGPMRKLFHGLAQLLVQSAPDSSGLVVVSASAPGLKSAEIRLEVRNTDPFPSVPHTEPLFNMSGWRMSPPSAERPDPLQTMSDADMNSWSRVTPGNAQKLPEGQWALYRSSFTPWKALQGRGGRALLRKVSGRAEVFLDGQRVAQKDQPAADDLSFAVPPSSQRRTLTVLLQAGSEGRTGLLGPTTLQLDSP
ncbi:MAG: beta-galactosidase GalA [Candidatus Methylacidiphilales bacterium]|nr:beta-galactosidase GalA [Candidatus Methylacidiphilales bacterium]